MSLSSGAAWLSALGSASLPVLLDAAIKGSAVLAVACIVSLFVRRASAATRHLIWFLAMGSLLVLPVLSLVLPGWQVLPRWVDVARPAADDTPGPQPILQAPVADASGAAPSGGDLSARPEPPHSYPASGPPLPERLAPSHDAAPSPWPGAALRGWVVPLWAAGAAAALLPALLGALSLWSLSRSARRITDGPWMALLERLSAGLGLRRCVVLLASERRSMPMAWGVWRPKLLLPAEAGAWPPGCLCAVLLHELGHVKRWDCLTQLVMRIACGLYWFNPLAWVALRCAVGEHERACDDVVLAAGGKPTEYAEYLLDVASRLPGRRFTLGVAIALARPSRLEGRLLAILDRRRSRRAVTRAAVLGGILALAALLMPLAVMRPMVQAEQTAAKSDPAAEKTTVAPASADGAAKEAVPSPQPGAGGGVRLAEWGEADHGVRVRLTAPEKEYRKIATLPLWAELENTGTTPLAPIVLWEAKVTAEVLDADGRPLRVRPLADVAPWEGRMTACGLAPGAAIRWTVGFDRFAFVDRPPAGTTVRLRLCVSSRDFNVASQWVELSIKDSPPAPVGPGDVPNVWAGFMDLVYREDGSAGPQDKPLDPSGGLHAAAMRAVHVDGRTGRVTVTVRSGGDDDWLGRHETVLDRTDLDRLAALLKRHAVWKLADLKPEADADGLRLLVGTQSLRLSLSVVGRLLDCEFPLGQAAQEPTLLALRKEMWALAAKVVARAHEDQKGWGLLSDEGLQARLRADKREWPLGQTPTLKADVRNLGMRDFWVAQAQQGWEVEVDGQWYRWTGKEISLKYSPLEPGREYHDIQFALVDTWRSKEGNKPLGLAAGKHAVQVAAVCMTHVQGQEWVRGVSNPVEIEVVGADTSASSAGPAPQDGQAAASVADNVRRLMRAEDAAARAEAARRVSALGSRADPAVFEWIRTAFTPTFDRLGADVQVDPRTGRVTSPQLVAFEGLLALGRQDLRPFAAALKVEDAAVRLGAAALLGRTGDSRAVSVLLPVLKDSDESVRYAAAAALGEELRDTSAEKPLIGFLRQGVPEAGLALGWMKSREAVEPLLEALKDNRPEMRAAAARALGNIADARAADPLLPLLKDASPQVFEAAAYAVGEMRERRAVEPLITALASPLPRSRQTAAWTLGRIGDPRAGEPLIRLMEDPGAEVRAAAAEALGRLRDRRAVPAIIAGLADPEVTVRTPAAAALGEIGDPSAAAPLVAALRSSDPHVRPAAARALGQLKAAEAVESLIGLLGNVDGATRWQAAWALGEIGDPRAVDALMAALDSSEYVPFLQEVAAALTKITGQNLGADPAKWRAWRQGGSASAGAPKPERDAAGRRVLDLRGKKATDADLAKLKEGGDLDVLYVSGEGVTDAGLKELQGLKGLRELHLWDGNFTDAGLRELGGIGGLEVLYLRDGKITPAGLRTCMKTLKPPV